LQKSIDKNFLKLYYTYVNARKRGDNLMFNERALRAQMVLQGINTIELSKRLNINPSTFQRKMSNNGSFTRKEINELIKILNISNPMEIFFADKLT